MKHFTPINQVETSILIAIKVKIIKEYTNSAVSCVIILSPFWGYSISAVRVTSVKYKPSLTKFYKFLSLFSNGFVKN